MVATDPTRALVVGIGNVLRGDDGIGWLLAEEALAGRTDRGQTDGGQTHGGLAVRAVHQLTPELAPELAGAGRVLFIDAWLPPADLAEPVAELRALAPATAVLPAGPAASHQLDPATLLGLTALLYGHVPQAMALLVPIGACGHGPGLSASLRARLPQARMLLAQWLRAPLAPSSREAGGLAAEA
jgi:hydrogenase maturation protease